MYISKPNSPEELYKFFIQGMPLKPINTNFHHVFKRKGWNVYANFITGKGNVEGIRLEFYTVIKSYYPDWKLRAFMYADTQAN